MKLIPIEGNTQRLDGGAMFGNAPKVLWEKWLPPDAQNRIHLSCRALLLQLDNGRHVLLEAGIGAFFEPKLKERYGVVEDEHMLLKNLAAVGLRDRDIDAVILSHLHFDHAGGVLSAYTEGKPHLLFPKAKFYVGRDHLQRAVKPHLRDRASFVPHLNECLQQSGRLCLVEGPTHPDLDFGIRFRYVHGHTIGLMMAELEVDGHPLVFVSDLIPGAAWVHLPITMGYDRYPELLIDEKSALLHELEQAQGELFFTHDPKIPRSRVGRDDRGNFVALT
jgi:glyoxylase-like metal-dependent hydrolase (beta-lactamase superfamily II)